MKKILFIGLILSATAMFSCSDKSGQPSKTPEGDYPAGSVLMPLKLNSYFIYDGWETVPFYGTKDDQTRTRDSFVVAEQTTFAGRQASLLIHYSRPYAQPSAPYVPVDSSWYDVNDNSIWRYFSTSDTLGEYFDPCWVQIYKRYSDFSDGTIDEKNDPYLLVDTSVVCNYATRISASMMLDTTLKVKTQSYGAKRFNLKIDKSIIFNDYLNYQVRVIDTIKVSVVDGQTVRDTLYKNQTTPIITNYVYTRLSFFEYHFVSGIGAARMIHPGTKYIVSCSPLYRSIKEDITAARGKIYELIDYGTN